MSQWASHQRIRQIAILAVPVLLLFLSLIAISGTAQEEIPAEMPSQEAAVEETPESVSSDLVSTLPLLSLIIKDVTTNQIISSVPVMIGVRNLNTGFQERVTQYLSEAGVLTYHISPGNWEVSVKVLNQTSSEVDYSAEHHFNVQSADTRVVKTFYVSPVGILEGVVVDSSEHLIAGADLDFACKADGKSDYPSKTDKYGSFRSVLVPAGTCKVFASFLNSVGVVEAEVVRGNIASVKIPLNQSATPVFSMGLAGYLVGGIIVLVIGIILFLSIRQRLRKRFQRELTEVRQALETNIERKMKENGAKSHGSGTEELTSAAPSPSLNPRARDIVKTLNERETKIVDALVQNKFEASQSVLRHLTGIPKTSLSRSFSSLEAKKVLTVEKQGKMIKVKLTDWFLGKD